MRLLNFFLCIISVCAVSLIVFPQVAHADFSDTFTAPDGTDLQIYNPIYNPDHPITIQNNSITPNPASTFINAYNFVDGCISMDWTGNSTNTNMSIRNTGDNGAFYGFIQFSGTWLLYRTDANHIIANGNMDFSGTHNYKLCAIGSTISVYKDGVQFASGTDTSIQGSGGQAFYSEGNTLDNLQITDLGPTPTPTATATPTPAPQQLTTLSPANLWMNKPIGDFLLRVDVLAEAYKDNTLVSSGQLNSVTVGTIFGTMTQVTVPFNSFSPVNFPTGSQLKIKVSTRNACSGSLDPNGTVRLFYNDSGANSRFDATIGGSNSNYYLRNAFALATTVGAGPRQNVSVSSGAQCSAFKTFGTWIITP